MKRDFDFDEIGKRTPYRTPDGFFEEMQRKVMERAGAEDGTAIHRRKRLRLAMAVVAMAAMLAGVLFVPQWQRDENTPPATNKWTAAATSDTAKRRMATDVATRRDATNDVADTDDKWIEDLSDEELEELVNFSENDVFFELN